MRWSKLVLLGVALLAVSAPGVRADPSQLPPLVEYRHGPRHFLAPAGSLISFDDRSDSVQALWIVGDAHDNVLDLYLKISVVDGHDLRAEVEGAIAKSPTHFIVNSWTCASGKDAHARNLARCGRRLDSAHLLVVSINGSVLAPRQTEMLVERVAVALRGYAASLATSAKGPIHVPRLVTFEQRGVSLRAPAGWYVWVGEDGDTVEATDRAFRPNAWIEVGVRSGVLTVADLLGTVPHDAAEQDGWLCGGVDADAWLCGKTLDASHWMRINVGGSLRTGGAEALAKAIAASLTGLRVPPAR